MKKIILTSSLLLLLGACSSNVETTKEEKPKKEISTEQQENKKDMTQEELNEQLKKEATKANFVEINVDNPPNGKRIYIDGEVSILTEGGGIDTFTLTSKEDNNEYGIYKIELANTTDAVYSEGDIVRIYGTVNDKDETGMPKILATILEKK